MKICKTCGNQLEDYAVFCPNCGTTLEVQQPQYQQPVVDTYTQPEAVEEIVETEEDLIAKYISAVEAAEKKSKLTFIISMAFAAVMLLALGGAALIGVFNLLSLLVTIPACAAALIFIILNVLKLKTVCPEADIKSLDEETLAALQNAQKTSSKIKSTNAVSLTAFAASVIALLYTIAVPILGLIASGITALIYNIF